MASDDLLRTEQLGRGEKCEFQYPARDEWLTGTVIRNGGGGYWLVRDDSTTEGNRGRTTQLHIENIRAPGTDPRGR